MYWISRIIAFIILALLIFIHNLICVSNHQEDLLHMFYYKAVNQYINKVYNLYDINQQKSDDIRVLKSSVSLIPNATNEFGTSALYNKTYEVDLPDDYLHILNCVAEYQVKKNYKCYDSGDSVHFWK